METIELNVLLAPLRKWWWLLALSTLLAGVSSAIYTKRQPDFYRSTTTLMVGSALMDPNPNSGEFNLASQLATAYADLARRSVIREATMRELGLEWLPEYSAYALPNSQMLEISVVDTSPERAQAVAAELANQLIQQTPGANAQQDRISFLDEQMKQLEASIVATTEEISRLEQVLTGLFSARQIADTKAQIAALESKLSTLQSNYTSLLSNSRQGATNIINILDPAALPTSPQASALPVNTAIAAMMGFALAAAGAYLIEYLDGSMCSAHEVSRALKLMTLGVIPRVSRRDLSRHGPLAMMGPRTSIFDAYAALRLNLQAALDDSAPQILVVTSPGPQEGKSTIAANLAVDWAHTGQRVILIDADLYRPSQQRIFDLPNQMGLTNALVDPEIDLDDLIKTTNIQGLSVLTSGPILPNPTPLLAQQTMNALLASLRTKADIIVIDTPPATAVVDASILALQADGLLLVVSANRTKQDMAQLTVERFQQIHTRLLGVALFNAPVHHTLYRDYYSRDRVRSTLSDTLPRYTARKEGSHYSYKDTAYSIMQESGYVNGNGHPHSYSEWNQHP